MLSHSLPTCLDCGNPASTGTRGPARSFCDDCRKLRAAARRRTKAGVRVRVGSTVRCCDCSSEFVCARGAPSRCKNCRRDRRRAGDRNRRRHLRATSAAYRINDAVKVQIRKSLKGAKNGRAWEGVVGYKLSDLMRHLECRFLPGMAWENHGEWHIDHIRPLCTFNFETPDDLQFREAWALANLQPLWAADNIRKGGRWSPPE